MWALEPETQVPILVLTFASGVCLTFEKSYISWNLCKEGETYLIGSRSKLNEMMGKNPLEWCSNVGSFSLAGAFWSAGPYNSLLS